MRVSRKEQRGVVGHRLPDQPPRSRDRYGELVCEGDREPFKSTTFAIRAEEEETPRQVTLLCQLFTDSLGDSALPASHEPIQPLDVTMGVGDDALLRPVLASVDDQPPGIGVAPRVRGSGLEISGIGGVEDRLQDVDQR